MAPLPARRHPPLVLAAILVAVAILVLERLVCVGDECGVKSAVPVSHSRSRQVRSTQKRRVPTVPTTVVHQLGRGFTCFDNLYAVNGQLMLNPGPEDAAAPPPGASRYGAGWSVIPVREFLAGDGDLGDMLEMPSDLASVLSLTVLYGVMNMTPSAFIMNEWKAPDKPIIAFTSHYGHFIEEIASGLILQAATGLPTYASGLCCRCKENFAGEGLPLNRWVMDVLWGADWRHCNDWSTPGWWGTPVVPDPPVSATALHMERACMVDRYAAHKDWRTDAVNNCNTLLMEASGKPGIQARMEQQLARFRAHSFIKDADLGDLKDLYGTRIADILAQDSATAGPLVTIQQRKAGMRSILPDDFTKLVEYVKTKHTKRVLAIRWELLPVQGQLAVAAASDILIGMQGNGLSHLLWMKMGSAVMEFFPHYRSDGEGTGWTNDWPYLTRLKGNIYRAADTSKGAQNPVAHPIRDEERWLNVHDLPLEMSVLEPVVDDTFASWHALQAEVKAAGGSFKSVDVRSRWNPAWKPEDGEDVFYAADGWHPNHARRRAANGGLPVGGE